MILDAVRPLSSCPNGGNCLTTNQKYILLFSGLTGALCLTRLSRATSLKAAAVFTSLSFLTNQIPKPSYRPPQPADGAPEVALNFTPMKLFACSILIPFLVAEKAPDCAGKVYCRAIRPLVSAAARAIDACASHIFREYIQPACRRITRAMSAAWTKLSNAASVAVRAIGTFASHIFREYIQPACRRITRAMSAAWTKLSSAASDLRRLIDKISFIFRTCIGYLADKFREFKEELAAIWDENTGADEEGGPGQGSSHATVGDSTRECQLSEPSVRNRRERE